MWTQSHHILLLLLSDFISVSNVCEEESFNVFIPGTIKTDCAARCELCSVSDVRVDTILIFLDARYSVRSGPNSPVQPPPRTPSLLHPAGRTKPLHYFSPGWAWAPPTTVCVCVWERESMCVWGHLWTCRGQLPQPRGYRRPGTQPGC